MRTPSSSSIAVRARVAAGLLLAPRTLAVGVGVAVAVATAPTPASAQYFGRNKVLYEDFDFRVLRTPHYDIHWYPAESLAVADAARMAERWWSRHGTLLGLQPGRKPILLYADHPDFEQTFTVSGFIDQGTGGVTEGLRERVVLPFTGIGAADDHVLGHELVHSFQFDLDLRGDSAGGGGGRSGLMAMPLFVVEGMAEYLSIGRRDASTTMWLRDALLRDDLPSLQALATDPDYFPYRHGHALWAYIGGRWGDDRIAPLLRRALLMGWDAAVQSELGLTTEALSREWRSAIREAHTPMLAGRTTPAETGRPLLRSSRRGDFNISPTVSPDGRWIAFISSRNLVSLDLFVADARTGRVVKRITSPNTDSHFDALSYVSSAGSWSPDGSKLAFAVFAQGDNELAIFDVNSRRVERRIRPRGIGALSDPAWSPDGGSIAFVGQRGGTRDLYVYTLATDSLRQLTADRYAELQPAWSPDGRQLAFATDRGPGTDLAALRFAPPRLAVMDVESGAVRLVEGFDGAKHIDPQWTADGQELFFVSDADGVSDVYRVSLATGAIRRVTRVATGISGVTALSPAIALARNTGALYLTVFTNAGYVVNVLDAERTAGEPVTGRLDAATAPAAQLVPPDAPGTALVDAMLADATTGLPAPGELDDHLPYRPRLSLEYIGSPGVGVATNLAGRVAVAGGVAAYFGDMLGQTTLGTTVALNGTLKDLGGELFYMKQRRRWGWIAAVAHVPYLTGYSAVFDSTVSVGGLEVPARYYQQLLARTFVDQASFTAHYPLSQTRRIELGGSYTNVSYDYELQEIIVTAGADYVRTVGLPKPPGFGYWQGSAATVKDFSVFGFTSPIAGGRSRFEVAPVFGDVDFLTLLGDWRRYVFLRPYTVAGRSLYLGRHGGDAEDRTRVSPLFIGDPTLVRGYSYESFSPSECRGTEPTLTGGCPAFDRLIGSRLAVVNLELRVPLFGNSRFGLIDFPWLPTEVAPFVDAGVTWSDASPTNLRFDRTTTARVPVVSTGVAVRMNLFGYLVLEIHRAYPFQRPGKGWHTQFVIAPGW
jgi:Tol biopolymer transport system component